MTSSARIVSRFRKIGARAFIQPMTRAEFRQHGSPFVIDIRTDNAGEVFEIQKTRRVDIRVLDSAVRQRHLVRGDVSHPDHATLYLPDWHLVQVNRETSPAEQKQIFAPRRMSRINYRD